MKGRFKFEEMERAGLFILCIFVGGNKRYIRKICFRKARNIYNCICKPFLCASFIVACLWEKVDGELARDIRKRLCLNFVSGHIRYFFVSHVSAIRPAFYQFRGSRCFDRSHARSDGASCDGIIEGTGKRKKARGDHRHGGWHSDDTGAVECWKRFFFEAFWWEYAGALRGGKRIRFQYFFARFSRQDRIQSKGTDQSAGSDCAGIDNRIRTLPDPGVF
ncbi:hypothetical protein DOT_1868 [Desulfosporosinus sp. OT]|nr:hypothetical protein DOT_1868 [Desulfosporosinus sp. OT]